MRISFIYSTTMLLRHSFLALQCYIVLVQAAEQFLLSYLDAIIQDVHAILAHLLYF
jgi:hypothetical protein